MFIAVSTGLDQVVISYSGITEKLRTWYLDLIAGICKRCW